MHCSQPGCSVHGILQARILEWVASPSPGDLPDPGIKPTSPGSSALQADSLPSEPLEKSRGEEGEEYLQMDKSHSVMELSWEQALEKK